jgi:hypothetical protein
VYTFALRTPDLCVINTLTETKTTELKPMTFSSRSAAALLARDARTRQAKPVTLPKAPFPLG